MSRLNYMRQFIQSFKGQAFWVLPTPDAVKSDLLMFLSFLPETDFDFRSADTSGLATASDASMLGGGICASGCLSTFGASVAALPFTGPVPSDLPNKGVVCIGLVDGICGLQVAPEALSRVGSLCSSCGGFKNFQHSRFQEKVEDVTSELCTAWVSHPTLQR